MWVVRQQAASSRLPCVDCSTDTCRSTISQALHSLYKRLNRHVSLGTHAKKKSGCIRVLAFPLHKTHGASFPRLVRDAVSGRDFWVQSVKSNRLHVSIDLN